jgi:ubiquinone biosynthesis protein
MRVFGVFAIELLRAPAQAWSLRGSQQPLPRALARCAARASERLGATFIKVVQIASTRSDLLPLVVIQEWTRLQDRVTPFPGAQAAEIVERELGGALADHFSRFETAPVASASVSQVHEATTVDGRRVAVKVRRPDVVEVARLDRRILSWASRGAERLVPSLRLISLQDAVDHFCDAVEVQLHLRNEAEHNLRFQVLFEDDSDIHFPELVSALCTDAVLTMEFIEALHERELESRGVDVERIVSAGMRAVCRMIFLHGFVHADLHPGNLRFEAPGRVVLLDLGLVGELSDEDRHTSAELLFAFATGNGADVARLFFEHAPHTACADYAVYEREISEFVASMVARGLGSLQLTLEIARIFDILRRHRIQARAHMTMVNLALMTAEGLAKRLAPDLALTDAALPYLAEALGVEVPPLAGRPPA